MCGIARDIYPSSTSCATCPPWSMLSRVTGCRQTEHRGSGLRAHQHTHQCHKSMAETANMQQSAGGQENLDMILSKHPRHT